MAFERTMEGVSVADAGADARVDFIRKTYLHLAGAIGLFALLEFILLGPLQEKTFPFIVSMMTFAGRWSWLVVLGIFMVVGWLADRWAQSDMSPTMQYIGLGLYVIAETVIFLPLLWIAANWAGANVLPTAILLTACLVVGLTATVFITKKDFSFLGTALTVGAFVALGVIVCAIVFGFNLGLIFSIAMLVLASGYLVYYTSRVLHDYAPGQHVAASLALFAAIALIFWYVLLLVIELSGND